MNLLCEGEQTCNSCETLIRSEFFLKIDVTPQIQAMLSRPHFFDNLQYRFHRKKINRNNYEDIYDGEIYKKLFRRGKVLSKKTSISFTWNSDGVKVFRSSNFTIWPLFLSINELNYQKRFKTENVILCGLWFGDHKPNFNTYVSPFFDEFAQLKEGVSLHVQDLRKKVKIRAFVLCGTCDLPAKALMLNMTQYNGKFGCHICKQKGCYAEDRWVYPFIDNLKLRTDNETRSEAESAGFCGLRNCGSIGPTILGKLIPNYITSTSIDVMHCAFEGVTKQLLLKIWIKDKNKQAAFSLFGKINAINHRIKTLKPPKFVQRRPRSLSDLKHWKASELKNWLFYYSVPVLEGILPEPFFSHYLLLVEGISILCSGSISEEDLNKASRYLTEFVKHFEGLYGIQQMGINVHLLLHLTDSVRMFGPLWVTSCFPYENFNGTLKNFVKSSKGVALQISEKLTTYIGCFDMVNQIFDVDSPARKFCDELFAPQKQVKLKEHLHNGFSTVGSMKKITHLSPEIRQILYIKGINGEKVFKFPGLFKNGIVYSSKNNKDSLTNSNVMTYSKDGIIKFGRALMYLKILDCFCRTTCECPAIYCAVFNKITVTSEFRTINFENCEINNIFSCSITNIYEVIEFEAIKDICFFLEIESKCYVALPVNNIESE